jgi:hypothetical protein
MPFRHQNERKHQCPQSRRGVEGEALDRLHPAAESVDRRPSLKKIPHPGDFKDLPSGQNGGDLFTLWSGENFIQLQLRHRLQRELPHAFVQGALSNEVGHGATFAIE